MLGCRFDFSLKIVVVGDTQVGKTCLLLRYIRDMYASNIHSTLGVEFMTKIIQTERHLIQLQLWDTAGQELFRAVRQQYYRNAAGALFVFDLTGHDSFDHIPLWLKEVKEMARPDCVPILVGNKTDLVDKRDVTRGEAEAFAAANNMQYFETSAATGENITAAIDACVAVIETYVDRGAYEVTFNPDEAQVQPDDAGEKGDCRC